MTASPLPKAIDAEYLTNVLGMAGVLRSGRVHGTTLDSEQSTILSRVVRLRLSYEADLNAPTSLILKIGRLGREYGPTGGEREVMFYSTAASVMQGPLLVPRCYDARCDPDEQACWVLLEDLSESHIVATEWPLPPTLEQCERIIAARARFHAVWWNDPRLGASIGIRPSAGSTTVYLEKLSREFEQFANLLGDSMSRSLCGLFERFLAEAPRLITERPAQHDCTLVQGDAHAWNCFLPRDITGDDIRLFDWDSWRLGPGSDDLAYMMAVHWYPDLRNERERLLLDHYYRMLTNYGVSGYSRQSLTEDYRLSALWQLVTPIWQAVYGIPPVIWWNNLERIRLAVDDLGCRDFLT